MLSKYLNLNTSESNEYILFSFPKSGNTWVRFILSNILVALSNSADGVDFHSVHSIIPELESKDKHQFSHLPIIYKTHSDWKKKFRNAIIVVRNPMDVMVSNFHFLNKEKNNDFSLSEVVRHPIHGITGMVNCMNTYLNSGSNLYLVSYEDLKLNPIPSLHNLCKFIGLNDVSESVILESYEKSNFDSMRKIEEEKGRKYGNADFKFTRSGKVGEGSVLLSSDDKKYLANAARKCWLLDYVYRDELSQP